MDYYSADILYLPWVISLSQKKGATISVTISFFPEEEKIHREMEVVPADWLTTFLRKLH